MNPDKGCRWWTVTVQIQAHSHATADDVERAIDDAIRDAGRCCQTDGRRASASPGSWFHDAEDAEAKLKQFDPTVRS